MQNSRGSGSYSASLLEEEKTKKQKTLNNLKKQKTEANRKRQSSEMFMYWNTFL